MLDAGEAAEMNTAALSSKVWELLRAMDHVPYTKHILAILSLGSREGQAEHGRSNAGLLPGVLFADANNDRESS